MNTPQLITLPASIIIQINSSLFTISNDAPVKGDLVLDRRNQTYGYCQYVHNNYITLKHENVVELGIPIASVYKLISVNPQLN